MATTASIAVPLASLAVVTLATFALPSGPLPQLAIVTPIAYFVAVASELATVAVLAITWNDSPKQRSTVVLALSCCATALLTALSLLFLPLMPHEPPVFDGFQRAARWIFAGWHLAAAAGGLTYALFRARGAAAATPRFIAIATTLAVLFAGGLIVVAFALGSQLPLLASGVSIAGLVTTGVGPICAILLAVSALLNFRNPGPTKIDRAFAFSLLGLALELTMFIIGGQRYSAAFYAGRLLILIGASFVLVAAVQTQLASRMRLLALELKLALSEDVATKQAHRIHALWQITSNSAQSHQERFNAILDVATSAIRPGKPMFGCLSHLEGDSITISAVSSSVDASMMQRYADILYSGATFPLERMMMQRAIYASGKTLAWNDLGAVDVEGFVFQELALRSLIGTSVKIGNQTYFITFGSTETMLEQPYLEDDLAYVDVVAGLFANLFAQKLQFERIQFQIEHDALTGLKNRAQFRSATRDAILRGEPFALAFLDLDGFQRINNEHGHLMGDEVLVEVAAELRGLNEANFIARMSADEFGILIYHATSAAGAEAALAEYHRRFERPFHTGDRDGTRMLSVGASVGGARFPEDGSSPEDLMKRADTALAQAKTRGGSSVALFDATMEHILAESHIRTVEFAEAIVLDQLALVYQPTFDLATRTIVGAEALVRWDHPTRGRLAPADFLPFAERSGQMAHVTRWVFHRLIRDIKRAELPLGMRIAFNLGARTLEDLAFIADLNETLCATPGLVDHLGIEVTETVAMHNIESAMHTINLFRSWGITVAIDDFGTDYSSLSYLKELVVDTIKIDRSFVAGLPNDERGGVITDMLLRVTDRFGFVSLAEGVETEQQVQWLIEHGCRLGQGYLVSRPCSFDELLGKLNAAAFFALN